MMTPSGFSIGCIVSVLVLLVFGVFFFRPERWLPPIMTPSGFSMGSIVQVLVLLVFGAFCF